MKEKIAISIPKPCTQNWHSMLPNEQGKFCNNCQKTVVDLSRLSNTQILEHIALSGKICGRITESQLIGLNEPIVTEPRYCWWKRLSVAATFMAFVSLIKAETKGSMVKPLLEQGSATARPQPRIIDTPIIYKKITGVVTDTLGEVLPGATVRVKGLRSGTITAQNGIFVLNVPASGKLHLLISFIGYKQLDIVIDTRKNEKYTFKLHEERMLMGEVVIVKQ